MTQQRLDEIKARRERWSSGDTSVRLNYLLRVIEDVDSLIADVERMRTALAAINERCQFQASDYARDVSMIASEALESK